MKVKCTSCGAQTDATKGYCEFCGSALPKLEVTSKLDQIYLDKAKKLGLESEIVALYQGSSQEDLVGELLELASSYVDSFDGKIVDLLADLARKHDENDERSLLLTAQAKFVMAANLANNSSAATLRQRYLSEARKLLAKVESEEFKQKKTLIEGNLDQIENFKSGSLTSIAPSLSLDETKEGVKITLTEDTATKTAGTIGGAIGAVIGIILAALIGIAMFAPFM